MDCPVMKLNGHIKLTFIESESIYVIIKLIQQHDCDRCRDHPFKGRVINGRMCFCYTCKKYKQFLKAVASQSYEKLSNYFKHVIYHYDVVSRWHGFNYWSDNLKVNFKGHYFKEDPILIAFRSQLSNINNAIEKFHTDNFEELSSLRKNLLLPKIESFHIFNSRKSTCDCDLCNVDMYFKSGNIDTWYKGFSMVIENYDEFLDKVKYNELCSVLKNLQTLEKIISRDDRFKLGLGVIVEYFNNLLKPIRYVKQIKLKIMNEKVFKRLHG